MRTGLVGQVQPPELRDAWGQYLDEVRDVEPGRYGEVEPWAWARLQARLRIVKRELAKRKAAA